jgi:pimeloyl-ACP methyl ester carboxylesterase
MHTQGVEGWAPTRDGRRLFYQELAGPAGARTPTVVLDGGMAASRSWWSLVQPRVAQWARAVVYDRSGLGRSGPDASPRTLARMSEDLNDLLDHLGAEKVVLVAHSGSGVIVRAAAAARPERIAGLVLVEVTDEACEALFDPAFRKMERTAQSASMLLARLGLLKALYAGQVKAFAPDVRADVLKEGFTVAAIRTRGAELAGLVAATNDLRTRRLDLPDVPVTVISGVKADGGMSARVRAAANASHAFRAAQSPRGRHVLAPNSGHMAPVTDAQLIADEIKRVIDTNGAKPAVVIPESAQRLSGTHSSTCAGG